MINTIMYHMEYNLKGSHEMSMLGVVMQQATLLLDVCIHHLSLYAFGNRTALFNFNMFSAFTSHTLNQPLTFIHSGADSHRHSSSHLHIQYDALDHSVTFPINFEVFHCQLLISLLTLTTRHEMSYYHSPILLDHTVPPTYVNNFWVDITYYVIPWVSQMRCQYWFMLWLSDITIRQNAVTWTNGGEGLCPHHHRNTSVLESNVPRKREI